jgi:hypothetical protein
VLSEFFEAHIAPDLPRIREYVRERFDGNAEAAGSEAIGVFADLCGRALGMQEAGLLGDVVMINISFLRIGLAEGKGLYRIDICDKDWLTARKPCFALWDAAFAFDPYFEFVRAWKDRARAFSGVREVDIDMYASEFSVFPRFVADAFLASEAQTFAEHPSCAALSGEESFRITLGEYRDAQTDILRSDKEKEAE